MDEKTVKFALVFLADQANRFYCGCFGFGNDEKESKSNRMKTERTESSRI